MASYAQMLLGGSDAPAPELTAAVQPATSYSVQLLGGDQPPQPQAQQPQQKEGWGEWIVNSVKGRQDPNYKDVGTVFDQFHDTLNVPTRSAAILGASDPQMADIVQKNLGDKFIRREKDSHGYDVFVTRGPNGEEQKGYLNKPGLDMQDVSRAAYGSMPYLAVGGGLGMAARGAGIGTQALLQGAGAASTSVAGDVAQIPMGSEQGIDVPKAAITGAAGVIAPPIAAAGGALWRKFVTIPGLVDSTTGQLTAKGIAAAKQAGIDPADITPDFAQSFAKSLATTKNPAQAATDAGLDQFGIPATQGQRTKDPFLLTQEEGMRRRLYGESAQDTMRAFDQKQQDAIRYAALGTEDGSRPTYGATSFPPKQGIAEQINPGRQPGAFPSDRAPSTLGNSVQDTLQSARGAAKQQESNLWDDSVRDLGATDTALGNLRPHMEAALADETAFSPTGQKMAQEIGQYAEGKLPVEEAGGIKLKQVQSVDQMRRRLGSLVASAEPGADKHQAGKIYEAFNDWITDSAQKRLLLGEPAAAMQLVKARGFTKEVRQIFEPKTEGGTLSPAGQRLSKILSDAKADSGEGVIQALLGSEGSRGVNQGSVSALKSIKIALDKFAKPDQAAQAWNDIRLAHWTRMVTGKNGELVGPTAMVNNLKSAMQGQSTVMTTLYSPTELRQMRLFIRALENVAYKPPNASGSGYSAATFAKEGVLKLLDAFGVGTPARAALQYTGISNAWNSAAAKNALRRVAPASRPNLAPAATGAARAYQRSQDGGR